MSLASLTDLAIATWNVNGIRAREAQFLEWVGRDRPDVVCLQEIKASPDKLSGELCELAGFHCYWHGTSGYSGVGLHLSRERFATAPRWFHPAFDHEDRIVAAELPAADGDLVVASIYVPNGGKDYQVKIDFLTALGDWAGEQARAGKRLLLCGDLNVALTDRDLHPKELRKPDQIGIRPEERELLGRVIAEGGLVDVGRASDPDNDRLYTWWAPWRNMRQRNIGWRIDYVLASEALWPRVASCRVYPEVGTSDHAPVVARFDG